MNASACRECEETDPTAMEILDLCERLAEGVHYNGLILTLRRVAMSGLMSRCAMYPFLCSTETMPRAANEELAAPLSWAQVDRQSEWGASSGLSDPA